MVKVIRRIFSMRVIICFSSSVPGKESLYCGDIGQYVIQDAQVTY